MLLGFLNRREDIIFQHVSDEEKRGAIHSVGAVDSNQLARMILQLLVQEMDHLGGMSVVTCYDY
jgi:hypothetical protein